MKKTIAVDIDDVLALNAEAFVDYCNKRWGTQLTVDDYDEDWFKLWGVDEKESGVRVEQYLSSGTQRSYAHHETAVSVLKELKNRYKIVIVTSRNSSLLKETRDWLDQYFEGIFSEVHHASLCHHICSQTGIK